MGKHLNRDLTNSKQGNLSVLGVEEIILRKFVRMRNHHLNQAIGIAQQFSIVPQYCKDCAIEHLSKDCPNKPIVTTTQVGKIGLSLVEIIPSLASSETKPELGNVPLKVITRAQAREVLEENHSVQAQKPEDENGNKKKKRGRPRQKRTKSKKSLEGQQPSEEMTTQVNMPDPITPAEKQEGNKDKDSKVSEGGFVLVERVNEHLDAIRMAHENFYATQVEIPKKLQEYPNPRKEKVNLAVHQKIIRDTQAILEGQPKPILQGLVPHKPTLETIPEVSSSTELGSEYQTPPIYPKPTSRVQFTTDKRREESLTKSPFNDDILEVEEITAQEMWDAVRRNVDETRSADSPPFSLVDFVEKRSIAEPTNQSKEKDGSIDSFPSKHILLTMPSYLGDYEARLVVVKVPSIWKSNQNKRDTANMHALMSAPVTCTLPLMDLLKVRLGPLGECS